MAKLLPVVAAALIDRDGKVLLAERPPGKDLAGLWEFPGGKINEGETPEAALVRELREELGIETEASCLAPLAFSTEEKYGTNKVNGLEEIHLLILLYVCRKWTGTPTGLERQRLKWVKGQEVLQTEMPPADKPLAVSVREILC